jgi:integrase
MDETLRKKETSRANDKYIIDVYKRFMTVDVPTDTITTTTADAFIKFLCHNEKKRKDGTVVKMTDYGLNYYIRAMRAIFEYAHTRESIAKNPFAAVGYLEPMKKKLRDLKATELDNFFEALLKRRNGKKHWDIMHCYLATGCRHNEARNLTWDDVDFEKGMIAFWVGAKHKRYRVVLMYDVLREMLLRRFSSASGARFPMR